MANTIALYTSLAEINRKVCTDDNPSHQLVEKNPHHNVQDPIVKHIPNYVVFLIILNFNEQRLQDNFFC
jgi:hypothetical protein